MRFELGKEYTDTQLERIAFEEASAHVQAMDLEQFFGPEAMDASHEMQERLTQAKRKVATCLDCHG